MKRLPSAGEVNLEKRGHVNIWKSIRNRERKPLHKNEEKKGPHARLGAEIEYLEGRYFLTDGSGRFPADPQSDHQYYRYLQDQFKQWNWELELDLSFTPDGQQRRQKTKQAKARDDAPQAEASAT